jgi:hypothetical protein
VRLGWHRNALDGVETDKRFRQRPFEMTLCVYVKVGADTYSEFGVTHLADGTRLPDRVFSIIAKHGRDPQKIHRFRRLK